MNKVIIFGTGKIADVIFYYLQNESEYTPVAFTVDKEYIKSDSFNGLPVIDFKEIQEKFPPGEHKMFVAMGYQDLNDARTEKLKQAKAKNYELISYIHPESGAPKDLQLGENCFVMNNVCIHPRVKIGSNVFIWSGTMIGHHSEVRDNCWLTSCANISGNVKVGKNCFFAVNSTVAHSVEIGNHCFLGANALVTKHLKDEQVVIEQSTKPFRLNSRQFLRMSNFSSL